MTNKQTVKQTVRETHMLSINSHSASGNDNRNNINKQQTIKFRSLAKKINRFLKLMNQTTKMYC